MITIRKNDIIEVVKESSELPFTDASNLILAGRKHSNYTTVSYPLPPTNGGFIVENIPNTSLLTPKQLTSFLNKVNKIPNGCWLWTGTCNSIGYGQVGFNKKYYLAHRLCYQLFKGDIPKGLCLDHLCRVRNCVNPDHLDPVTQKENLLRGATLNARNVSRTHCPHGHPYDEENTKIRYLENGDTARRCRACIRMDSSRHYRKKMDKQRNMSLKLN